MHNEDAFNSWMFNNFIALHFYYKICNFLREHKLLRKYSPSDSLLYIKSFRKMKINTKWIDCEITNKTQKLFEKISLLPIV